MNILITGGASGLGKAITEKLAEQETNNIFFTYNKSKDQADRLAIKLSNATAIQCNFRDAESIDSLCLKIKELDIDILVNNAFCGMESKHFHKISGEAFLNSFQYNVLPTLRITQAVLAICRKKKRGKIVTILSSYIMNKPPIGLSEYVANKAYLLSMHKSWVNENTKFNITSYCISPSFMQTPLNADVDERIVDGIIANHPLKKILTPEEVASTVDFLCSAPAHLNGINILMNSGENI